MKKQGSILCLISHRRGVISVMKNIEKTKTQAAGTLVTPKGFHAAGLHSGVKRKRNDLGVIYCEQPAQAAAVYTMNQVKAAPIYVTKESIEEGQQLQAIIVNSGNANACMGEQGMQDAYKMREVTANKLGVQENDVAVASTGVIGIPMPMDKIVPHIEKLKLGQTKMEADAFAESILTTDTFSKSVCCETEIDGETVTMAGVAKGSGMIEPNMGTMLGFLTTDAVIEADMLQLALKESVDETFNCITVDGDTSTNDMVITMASELAGNHSLTPGHPEWEKFVELMKSVSQGLSQAIARDGEGATKLIEVEVSGAESDLAARKVAKTITASSLVKTAIFGSDANWGRFIVAVGYSGETIDPQNIDMSIGSLPLLQKSEPVEFSEEEAKAYLQNETINIYVDLNIGNGSGKAWGCDLTYDYVRINASYRT